MPLPDLSKASCLYLEDEHLIAMDGAFMLEALGFETVEVVHTLARATAAAETRTFDFALFDVNLGNGETSIALAEALIARGTRLTFATGYVSDGTLMKLPAPSIQKPFSERDIERAFADLAKDAGAEDSRAED